MKQFFEQYGAIALGILALLVLIAMITPVGNLIKVSLQGTVQTFSAGIESQSNAIDFVTIASGTKLKIGDRHYIVIEKMGLAEFKLLDLNYVTGTPFNDTLTHIYENSNMDNYLNNEYYNLLPENIKNSIVELEISQNFYSFQNSNRDRFKPNYFGNGKTGIVVNGEIIPWEEYTPSPYLTGVYYYDENNLYDADFNNLGGEKYNRKVFLLSMEEASKICDLNNELSVNDFVSMTGVRNSVVLRDGWYEHETQMTRINPSYFSIDSVYANETYAYYPVYVLNLANLDFEIE